MHRAHVRKVINTVIVALHNARAVSIARKRKSPRQNAGVECGRQGQQGVVEVGWELKMRVDFWLADLRFSPVELESQWCNAVSTSTSAVIFDCSF